MSSRSPSILATLALALGLALGACGGGGPYSYARTYQPADGEQAYLSRASAAGVADVQRARPEDQPYVSWFGVVLDAPAVEGSTVRLHLSFRVLQERPLCSSEYDDSCRVTVSEREIGRFVAVVPLRPADLEESPTRLGPGSLVRVFGRSEGQIDDAGDPIIVSDWYRHWPRNTFVTTAMSGRMRR